MTSPTRTVRTPLKQRLVRFFVIPRDGIGGKVVDLTEFSIRLLWIIFTPFILLIPDRIFWIPTAFPGLLAPNELAKSVSREHARFFRVAPHVGPNTTKNALRRANSRYLAKTMMTFIGRFHWYGNLRRKQISEEAGIPIPITYLISPTMRCNLMCGGCYAAKYATDDDMSFEVLDRVITEGKDMAMYNVFVLGGEPFIREDMLDICKKHKDVFFQVFTNGTLFTDELAKKLSKMGNVVPLISIEGFEEDTDRRRGKGTFQKIMTGMDNLRRYKVPFGYSAMVTRLNVDTVISDEFNDMLIDKGCMIGWQFLYIPVGRHPDPSLMPTPEQRLKMQKYGAERIRTYKPILTIDFWNDAPFTNGCIAGGQNYFHINAHGDLEPCIFIHFATENVKEKPLLECLKAPFFKAFRDRQPYHHNLLRPCAIVDHPHVLREILAEHKPYGTHPDSDVLVTDCASAIDEYSAKAAEVMDTAWEQDYGEEYVCNYFPSVLKHSREKYEREGGKSPGVPKDRVSAAQEAESILEKSARHIM
jgi:MoaA/NifB/PqqE/SkfB family radical SAM enzyme